MNCPKCNFVQAEENKECESCGIIFTKYYLWLESKNSIDNKRSSAPNKQRIYPQLLDLLLYIKPDESPLVFWGRLVLFVGIILWSFRFVFSPIESNYAGESFMHLINLPFHEAGHIFFRPFGALMTSLGGTIAQCALPLVCLFVLLLQTRDTFGAAVCLWWFGENFFDIAPYINDARSLSLPLVGGNFGHSSPYGFHDWEFILTEIGLVQYDNLLAKLSVTFGTSLFILFVAWGGTLLIKQFKNR